MTDLPTYHGPCPYCASAVSCVTRDGTTYARCSHRGCGARGPYHQRLDRAVELFRRGRLSNAIIGEESPRPPIDMEPEPPDAVRKEVGE